MVVWAGSAPSPPRGWAGGGGDGAGGGGGGGTGGGGCTAGGGGGGGGAGEVAGTTTVVNTVAVAVLLADPGGLGRTALASGIDDAMPPATERPGIFAGAAAAALK